MFRKHIVNTFLYTITSFKSSSGRPPRLQNPLRCARNQQPCYFLLSPGPIFPLNTKSFNYVFEYKKIEPGKQKDSVVSTISHLYTRGLIFQVAYTVPMFAKALHCRFFISHYNRKVDIVQHQSTTSELRISITKHILNSQMLFKEKFLNI